MFDIFKETAGEAVFYWSGKIESHEEIARPRAVLFLCSGSYMGLVETLLKLNSKHFISDEQILYLN